MYERAKTRKLANVLIGYYFRHHITNFDLAVQMDEDKTVISIRGKVSEKIKGIDALREKLFHHRKIELEDYYDELLGMRDSDDELELMSYMVDEASVDYENQILTFTIIRLRAANEA